jgi:predicted O-methyltransferase YrrM
MLSNQEISYTDYGAKFKKPQVQKRSIASIAKSSSQKSKHGEIIFKLVKTIEAKTILELGTSFGIGTAYLAMPSKKSKIISLEGAAEIAKIAILNHQKLNIENVDIRVGEFDKTLKQALNYLKKVDVVYFDGNHQKEATLNYFKECLAFSKEDSVFIFDDIYWSKGMAEAWKEICKHPAVSVSIDLYKIGIVFFKKDQVKENFTVYH